MRRAFVLALLFAGMQLIKPLGVPGFGALALLTFGFLILGAYAAGELAADIGIPKLVGYCNERACSAKCFGNARSCICSTRARPRRACRSGSTSWPIRSS